MTATAPAARIFHAFELQHVRVLLLDADGNLFASEEPAFAASAEVVNRLMSAIGCQRRYSADELRLTSVGKNFRAIAQELARDAGRELDPDQLEAWVTEERTRVTRHLASALEPDPEVTAALHKLRERYDLAVVTSSALARLDACLAATGLDELLPSASRFSAEDSLHSPTSKPHPAIYLAAAARVGITPDQGIAIEDAVAGVASARRAGFQTLGNTCFVRPSEREIRTAELRQCGVFAVVSSWASIERLLLN
jgi:HAD superfamily hydrolase (TIGR01509 family)